MVENKGKVKMSQYLEQMQLIYHITKIHLYNVDTLKPHFCIVKRFYRGNTLCFLFC